MNLQSKLLSTGDDEKLKEVKCFLSSLLYHCCEKITYNRWLEKNKCQWQYLKPERRVWKVDRIYWEDNFSQTWKFVQKKNLDWSTLFLAFDDFSRNELKLDAKSEEYFNLKNLSMNFFRELYTDNNLEQTLKLMNDQNQIDANFGKKLYLQKLASDISPIFVEPLFHRYNHDPFDEDEYYSYLQSKYCFISDFDGGRTIEKSTTVLYGVSDISNYHFTVLETGEQFRSPEQNARKAYLMYKKLRGPNSCAQELRLLNHVI